MKFCYLGHTSSLSQAFAPILKYTLHSVQFFIFHFAVILNRYVILLRRNPNDAKK